MSVCACVCLSVLYAFKSHSSDCPQILHEYSMAAGEKDRGVFLNSNAFRGRQRGKKMPFVRLLPNFSMAAVKHRPKKSLLTNTL